MTNTRIHHTGIATADGQKMVSFFTEKLGGALLSSKEYPEMQQISHMVQIGECQLEIMESTSNDGVVGKYLAKKGAGLHHLSIEVKDIVSLADELESAGVQLLSKSLEDPHVRYMFISPKSSGGVLIELCEYL